MGMCGEHQGGGGGEGQREMVATVAVAEAVEEATGHEEALSGGGGGWPSAHLVRYSDSLRLSPRRGFSAISIS